MAEQACQLIAVQCPECDGWGEVVAECGCPEGEYSADDPHEWETCTRCMGVGEVEIQRGPRPDTEVPHRTSP